MLCNHSSLCLRLVHHVHKLSKVYTILNHPLHLPTASKTGIQGVCVRAYANTVSLLQGSTQTCLTEHHQNIMIVRSGHAAYT